MSEFLVGKTSSCSVHLVKNRQCEAQANFGAQLQTSDCLEYCTKANRIEADMSGFYDNCARSPSFYDTIKILSWDLREKQNTFLLLFRRFGFASMTESFTESIKLDFAFNVYHFVDYFLTLLVYKWNRLELENLWAAQIITRSRESFWESWRICYYTMKSNADNCFLVRAFIQRN